MARRYHNKNSYIGSPKWLAQQHKKRVMNPKLLSWDEPEPDGYIYILTNEYISNLHKIGYTERDTSKRAKEISSATGVPGNWEVIFDWNVANAREVEQHIFSEVKEYRLGKSEIFDFQGLKDEDIIENISKIIAKKLSASKEYIEKTNAEKIEYQKIKSKNISIKEEVVLEVDKALANERLDTDYIHYVRNTIDEIYKKQKYSRVEKASKEANDLEFYGYGLGFIVVIILVFLQINSFLFYGLLTVAFVILLINIKSRKTELKEAIDDNLKGHMLSFPSDLEGLKPTIKRLGIKRYLNICGMNVHIAKGTGSDPNKDYIYLYICHRGEIPKDKGINIIYTENERDALISFITNIKSD